MDSYVLSEDAAMRLMRMLRWYERMKDSGPNGEIDGGGMRNKQFVQLDGSDAETEDGIDYYSGNVVIWDANAGAFTELGECWMLEPGGGALDVDGLYYGMQTGNVEVDSETRPCFMMVAGGGTGDIQLCRVWAAAVTAGSIDYYPAKFNELDVSTNTWNEGPLVGATYDCWLVQRFNFALTVGSGSGGGCYMSKRDGETKTLTSGSEYTLPVYVTTDRPTLGPDCVVEN